MRGFLSVTLFLLFGLLWGQTKESDLIGGSVKSPDGFTLSDVLVENKSTGSVVYSDADGNFTIEASPNDVLRFELLNHETMELNVGADQQYNIVLNESGINELEGVVITALGISKDEKKVGYATQEVETDRMASITTPSLGSMFSGEVAGMNVSNPTGLQQAPVITLRGKNPVIVIDGVIVNTEAYSALNQNDIENINILKGTTASALYGSRGKDGAILVTTKKAKREGVSVEFSQNTMFTAGYTVFPDTQKEYGAGSNGQYEFWDGADGGINDGDMIWGPKFVPGRKIAQWNSPILDTQTGQIIEWYGNVAGTQYDDRTRYQRVPIDWKYHDNLKTFLRTGSITNTNFAVNLKSEKGSLRLAGNYVNMEDRVPEMRLNRGGLSLNGVLNITDRLRLNSKLSYNRTYSPNIQNYDYNPANYIYTILVWMGGDVDGAALRDNHWVPGMEGYRQANFNYAWHNNPWFNVHHYRNERLTNVLNGQIGFEYDATDELSFKTDVSLIADDTTREIKSPKSYFNYSSGREGNYTATKYSNNMLDYNFMGTYTKDLFHGDVEIIANAGASGNYWKYNYTSSQTDGLIVPGVYNLGNSQGQVSTSNRITERLIYSLYATLDIGLFDVLYMNASVRNDWNSTLPAENRSYFYPSLSGSVLLNNLFNMNKSTVDLVKLYGSWAKVSGGLDPYSLNNYYVTGEMNYNGNQSAYYPSLLANSNIKPQTTESYEVGLSSSFFHKRLTLDMAYYRTLDYNQIIALPVSESSGYNTRYVNGNEYTTNGLEITVGIVPIKTENFNWKTTLNFATSEQKLTEIYGGQERFGNLRLNDRIDSYYDYKWMTNSEGQVILNAATGMPTRDPYVKYLGHFNPDWTFGFNNTFKYKNWKLDIGIDGSIGGVMRSQIVEKLWWGGQHPSSTLWRDQEYASGHYVFVPNGVNVVGGEIVYDVNGNILSDTRQYAAHTTPISWQAWSQNYPYQARVLEDEDEMFANVFDRTFIKLRSVVLEYDFTSLLNPNSFIKGISANISGYNLALWKKSKGLMSDPDFQIGGPSGSGNDIQDPSSRWIGMGFNVKF
ncbi:SusC/RagA family TonB-linked outer membrane protein [Moheibacter stercoris]|uniref:TonB-linked SusC/RagA family outer membrane protein n=1 Tax=Moheibacter stercoris TaxID=1628251 RepID=A0ABV2LX53_9FLAO